MALADFVNQQLVETFTAKATAVNAMVQELPSMAAALQYVVDVCESKQPAGLHKQPTRVKRIVAAPDLNDVDLAALSKSCEKKGFLCIRDGLRRYVAGFDVGITQARLGGKRHLHGEYG
ncbi:lactate utilization protein [Candidatus Desulfovibrio trichonymphae]|uniref:lactate utilization protein n=1 Tax=Candidatus Desulfovibrio trichonymphae TaxID=1725232 RepID=UPI001E4E1873|nr:lactate utilization protein [Candidatus Desulfovibrio trichonymphae]GHU97410.1 hypothetical protein AGMMS50248_01590 [Deltaproteobacteria bacterium]